MTCFYLCFTGGLGNQVKRSFLEVCGEPNWRLFENMPQNVVFTGILLSIQNENNHGRVIRLRDNITILNGTTDGYIYLNVAGTGILLSLQNQKACSQKDKVQKVNQHHMVVLGNTKFSFLKRRHKSSRVFAVVGGWIVMIS